MWNQITNVFNKFKILWKVVSNAQCILDKERIIVLLEENGNLKKDKEKLQNQLKIKKNTKFDGEFLWLNNDRICISCYDSSGITNRCISRLIRTDPEDEERFKCNICKNTYESVAAKKRFLEKHRTSTSQAFCRY